MNLHDELALQSDKRMLQEKIEAGEISIDELRDAVIVEMPCMCEVGVAFIDGEQPTCPKCGAIGKEIV